jgi:hypothetical protein
MNGLQKPKNKREDKRIVPDFLKRLDDFSNGGCYGGEHAQKGPNEPHLLREEYNYNDRYFSTMFNVAYQIIDTSHKDRYKKKHLHECSELHPEIQDFISEKSPEVKRAFETLFKICKDYTKLLPTKVGRFCLLSALRAHISSSTA